MTDDDAVATLRAACNLQLDDATRGVIDDRDLARDEILALLVPQEVLSPVQAMLKAQGAPARRVDAIRLAMGGDA